MKLDLNEFPGSWQVWLEAGSSKSRAEAETKKGARFRQTLFFFGDATYYDMALANIVLPIYSISIYSLKLSPRTVPNQIVALQTC